MRIGIVTGEYPPMQGGVGAYTSILAAELARQEQPVSVLSIREAQNSDPLITLNNSIQKWNFSGLKTIQRWAAQERLDVINIQFQTAAFGMSPFIHFLPDLIRNIPAVTTFHDMRFPYLFPKAGALRNWIVMHLARTSDSVIATNHEDCERLKHLKKVALIPIGSNILPSLPPDFDAQCWREKAGAKPGDFLVAYFGLTNRSKGLETLLEALRTLRGQNVPARLVIIGGGVGSSDPTNAAFAEEIRALIAKLNLQDSVYPTGYVNEEAVGAYLTASDGVVLPFLDGASYRRGSLMAAIRYGCAIVTTKPQVNIPLFRDNDNMRLIPAGDSVVLADTLRELYESPQKCRQLRLGAEQLSHEFEWPEIARRYRDFFEQVIA